MGVFLFAFLDASRTLLETLSETIKNPGYRMYKNDRRGSPKAAGNIRHNLARSRGNAGEGIRPCALRISTLGDQLHERASQSIAITP